MMHPYIQYSRALDPDLHKIIREKKKEQKNTVIDIHVAFLKKLMLDEFQMNPCFCLNSGAFFMIVGLG